jgi:anti-sigma factor RsiW
MNYHENETLIHAYLDNELDTTASIELLEHAQECAQCRSALDTFAELKENIGHTLPSYSTPPELRRQIMATVRPKPKFSWTKIFRWSVPIATAIALGVWVGVIFTSTPTDTNVIAWNHIHALKSGHLMDVISSDKHTVKPWFAGKTDFSPTVIDLASSGFPLLGARAEYLDGHDAAALVYTNGKHYLELYEWPKTNTIENENTGIFRGFHTATFTINGMHCYLISDASNEELQKLKNDLLTSSKQP